MSAHRALRISVLVPAALVGLVPAALMRAQAPPDNATAARLAPVVSPAQPAARDQLQLHQLKLPPGFRIEVYASSIANALSLRLGKRGTVFVGIARTDKVNAVIDDNGRRRVKVLVSGLAPIEWARLSRRHSLHRRSLEDL